MPEKYIPPDRSRYLLADEIERLLQAAASMGQFEKQYLTFVANTGVRPSESNAVRGFDVNTKEGFVRIRTLKQKKDIDVFRNIDLTTAYASELSNLIKVCGENVRLFPRSRQALWAIFKRAAQKAGLSGEHTLYSLRHSRCIYLMEATNDILYVSQQLGFTLSGMSVYWHCIQPRREKYIGCLPSFGSEPTP